MNLLHVSRYLKDPNVSTWRKLVGFAALAYVVMPFDFIPDVIPVIGWLDDIGAIALAASFISREVKRHAALKENVQVIDGTVVER